MVRKRIAFRALFQVLAHYDTEREKWKLPRTRLAAIMPDSLLDKLNLRTLLYDDDPTWLSCDEAMKLFDSIDQNLELRSETIVDYRVFKSHVMILAQDLALSRLYTAFSMLITILSVVHVTLEALELRDNLDSELVRSLNSAFLVFLVLEQAMLIFFAGVRAFFTQTVCIFELALVSIMAFIKVAEVIQRNTIDGPATHDFGKLFVVLVLLRSVRLVVYFEKLRKLALGMLDMPRYFAPVLSILWSLYYIYALVGMHAYAGLIKVIPDEELNTCGTYENNGYWPLNFDDFASSLVTLWTLMINNNWNIIADKMLRIEPVSTSWWILVVVVILTLSTATIIEIFQTREMFEDKAKRLVKEKKLRKVKKASQNGGDEANHEDNEFIIRTENGVESSVKIAETTTGKNLLKSIKQKFEKVRKKLLKRSSYFFPPIRFESYSYNEIFVTGDAQGMPDRDLVACIQQNPYLVPYFNTKIT
ncbi:Two pore calcium channel protein 2 [Cichlidogyrus casuarinus]|uniref:Two pore calcium channel protein 2 n=1 Tax=Cichlidogyrus casuarinus TaxID=1844966 RepID=A0ABD2QFZ4_9PLAT